MAAFDKPKTNSVTRPGKSSITDNTVGASDLRDAILTNSNNKNKSRLYQKNIYDSYKP